MFWSPFNVDDTSPLALMFEDEMTKIFSSCIITTNENHSTSSTWVRQKITTPQRLGIIQINVFNLLLYMNCPLKYFTLTLLIVLHYIFPFIIVVSLEFILHFYSLKVRCLWNTIRFAGVAISRCYIIVADSHFLFLSKSHWFWISDTGPLWSFTFHSFSSFPDVPVWGSREHHRRNGSAHPAHECGSKPLRLFSVFLTVWRGRQHDGRRFWTHFQLLQWHGRPVHQEVHSRGPAVQLTGRRAVLRVSGWVCIQNFGKWRQHVWTSERLENGLQWWLEHLLLFRWPLL